MNCWSIKSFVLCRCIVGDNFAVPSWVGSRHELTEECMMVTAITLNSAWESLNPRPRFSMTD